jgi:hypothetical protein
MRYFALETLEVSTRVQTPELVLLCGAFYKVAYGAHCYLVQVFYFEIIILRFCVLTSTTHHAVL